MEDHNSFFLEHNVIYWENDSPLLGSNWTDDQFTVDHNVYWNPKQREKMKFAGMSFEEWKTAKKQDAHSVIADPKFANAADHDFTFPADSPAAKIGITIPEKFGPNSNPTILDGLPTPPGGFVLPK